MTRRNLATFLSTSLVFGLSRKADEFPMKSKFLARFNKTKLIFIALLVFAASAIQPITVKANAAIPTGNLVLDLRANSSSSYSGSGTTWYDLSGNSNHATFQGSPSWSSSLGGSFAMDGTDHFTVPSGMSDFRNGLTISVYANFGSSSTTRNWERLVDFGNGSANNNFLFARYDTTNDLTFEIYNGSTSRGHCRFNGGILEDTWATYAVTLDGANCYIYRDGNFAISTSYNYLPSLVTRSNNYIGRSNWSDAYFDNGIAAVAIYNRYLNSTEMAALSAGQKDSLSPTITGPSSATGLTSSKSIPENSTAVHTFTANESVTWSKSGTDESFFSITSGGVLTITSRDFENPVDNGSNNTYVVIVTATDSAGNSSSQTLTVTVINVNEPPSININASSATHAISHPENSTSVVTYTATDVDFGASLSFSLSGSDEADFAINPSSGVLSFISSPDFEAPADSDANNQYVVVITVSDGVLTDAQTLTVTVFNVDENSSIGAPTIFGTINKGVAIAITITSDVAGKVRFFVGGKRISNCMARSTTGSYPNFSSTCLWKPPVIGRQFLTARITPTNSSFTVASSVSTEVWVNRRSNPR